jgi:transposase
MMVVQGIDIDRSTPAAWSGQVAAFPDPIVACIREAVLSSSMLRTDDASMPMLGAGSGKTKTVRLWVHAIDNSNYGGAINSPV